jgi:hypothetical protein
MWQQVATVSSRWNDRSWRLINFLYKKTGSSKGLLHQHQRYLCHEAENPIISTCGTSITPNDSTFRWSSTFNGILELKVRKWEVISIANIKAESFIFFKSMQSLKCWIIRLLPHATFHYAVCKDATSSYEVSSNEWNMKSLCTFSIHSFIVATLSNHKLPSTEHKMLRRKRHTHTTSTRIDKPTKCKFAHLNTIFPYKLPRLLHTLLENEYSSNMLVSITFSVGTNGACYYRAKGTMPPHLF